MRWAPPDVWQRLREGSDCPMCADIHLPENPFSYLVAELPFSYARLVKNQYVRGYTVVALKRHACELFELSPAELAVFWGDVARVARALDRLYRPTKINYLVFGHHCPHLHCHLVLHTAAEDPSKPVNMHEHDIRLAVEEYQAMAAELQRELSDPR